MFVTSEKTTKSFTEPNATPRILDAFLQFIYSGNVDITRWTTDELSILTAMMDKVSFKIISLRTAIRYD